jgi:hypothetical protein
MVNSISVDTLTLREIAYEAQCDPRSVARELRGERVRGVVGDRIRRALRKRDLRNCETREAA